MVDEVGALLNEIGNVLSEDKAYPFDGTLLYAEAAPQMVDMAIFKDLGDHLLFRLPMRGLSNVLLELWEASDLNKRWAAMQYWIIDGQFTASFTYPEEIDPNERAMDRRERILRQRYGNKRIVYPPI